MTSTTATRFDVWTFHAGRWLCERASAPRRTADDIAADLRDSGHANVLVQVAGTAAPSAH